MKRIFIVLLLIIFSSSFSLAKDNEKITVEEIENIFFGDKKKYPIINEKKISSEELITGSKIYNKNKKWKEKRQQYRGIAKCKYDPKGGRDEYKRCSAKIVRVVFSSSEKSQKRRPGDIFYALDAIESLVFYWGYDQHFTKKFDFEEGDKPVPGMVCTENIFSSGHRYIGCEVLKRTYYKKFEKFKKDSSNEKVLGHKFIKYIKQVRMVRRMEEKLGTDNYALLGDFLNATVAEVEKNNINPVLQKRRALLKKYSLILRIIKDKLNEEKYKSIDGDVSKLLNTYENLKAIPVTANQTAINFDEAVNIIFDANKLVQSSALSAKDNEEEKLLALASIGFMQTLIDSILSTIPEKYLVYTKEINQDFFIESELAELENIITTMTNKNKETKSMELKKNMDIINISFNPSDTLKKLNSLEIIDIADKPLTRDSTVEIINQEIRNNLDKEVLKDVRKIFQEMDRNELADITKEASDIASEVASSSSVKEATSNRAVDREYGGQNLKKLIGAARR